MDEITRGPAGSGGRCSGARPDRERDGSRPCGEACVGGRPRRSMAATSSTRARRRPSGWRSSPRRTEGGDPDDDPAMHAAAATHHARRVEGRAGRPRSVPLPLIEARTLTGTVPESLARPIPLVLRRVESLEAPVRPEPGDGVARVDVRRRRCAVPSLTASPMPAAPTAVSTRSPRRTTSVGSSPAGAVRCGRRFTRASYFQAMTASYALAARAGKSAGACAVPSAGAPPDDLKSR
jgi:hypothetical protein